MSKANFAPLDVYTILPRSNCRKCLLPSCLAFAAAIVAGSRKLTDCPDLNQVASLRSCPLPKQNISLLKLPARKV